MTVNFHKIANKKDALSIGIYATDASMYQILPLAVATPASRDEVVTLVQYCAANAIPMVARGAGTSLTGQAINNAQVIDVSKYLNRIIELNLDEGWVRVEPGVVCAELNAYLAPHGVHFAPDPATENRANIGGMIANNSAGMRSVRFGMTINHVLELEAVLATGEVVRLSEHNANQLAQICQETTTEGRLHREISNLVTELSGEIRERYPKVIRRSGGYALDALQNPNEFNLSKLFCGSEGTLGVILEAKLHLTPLPKFSFVCLAHFSSIAAALRAAPVTVQHGASAAELIDGIVLNQARQHPLTREISKQIQGNPAALLVIEVQGDDEVAVTKQIRELAIALNGDAYATPVMETKQEIAAVWQMRASALGLMTTIEGVRKPTPYIEDAAVPPENLADYIADVVDVCSRYDQPVSMFGHASVGLVHVRPLHDLHNSVDVAQMRQIQREVFPLVLKYGGSWSGEHGDGIVRGGFNQEFFGDKIYRGFKMVKSIFDPKGLMNPGKIIDTPPATSNLRYGSLYRPIKPKPRFRYKEGGLLGAVEQCSGVGACRKTLSGVMCPSYMATRDELHSTRGRANALRLALTGQLDNKGVYSPLLFKAMSLCLSCKGCKGECPNSVDMARLKAEVLQAWHDHNRINLRTRLFANMPKLGRLASGSQSIFINFVIQSWIGKKLLKSLFKVDAASLPKFSRQTLSHWFDKRPVRQSNNAQVILFNDSYTEYFLPEVGKAAVECLEKAGFSVTLATVGESQRIAISLGLLDRAKKHGQETLHRLDALSNIGDVPIVVCEPSSASALKQDLVDLLEDQELANRVAHRVIMLDQFLEQRIDSGLIQYHWRAEPNVKFVIHTHCHQKQLDGGSWTHKLLTRIPNAKVTDTNAGCCGMAGSFGYEQEHVGLSRKIAGQRLLPELKKNPDSIVVANGFSCRHQIDSLAGRGAMHLAEVLRIYIN